MRTPVLILLLMTASAASFAQTTFRTISNPAFQAGEYLEYRVHYGAVTAGIAKLEVKPDPVLINGRNCLHVVGQGISSKTFSTFFRVNDKYETFIDQESLMPWKFKRKIEEGSFHDYIEVDFDQNTNKAHQRKNNKPEVKTFEVPPYIQDVVSAFYYARTQDYTNAKVGDIYKFQNFIDKKVYDLDVAFMGREVITVGTIKYNCVKLKPLVVEGGIFQHKGDLWLWISDDANKIPVRVEAGLVIGSVQIDLKTAENLMHPMTSRVR
jgi:Protein of unknown function (DUF3108)